MRKFACPTPPESCNGMVVLCNQSIAQRSVGQKSRKAHNSSEEAFKCYAHYLMTQGYEQIGSDGFSRDGGPIQLLGKKSKFGSPLRAGKEGSDGNRVVPSIGGGFIV